MDDKLNDDGTIEIKVKPDAADMDEAAERATIELANVNTAEDVARWIKRWKTSAGHRRLNRALMVFFKV